MITTTEPTPLLPTTMNTLAQKLTSPLQKIDIKSVPGLFLIPNFLNIFEETVLWGEIKKRPWQVDTRAIQYYGYKHETFFPYSIVKIKEEIPTFLTPLIDKIMEHKIVKFRPDQIIINDYLPGQGIRPHFDRKDYFDEQIVGVSLGSDIVMEWTRSSDEKVSVPTPARSLYMIEGPARYEFQHSIPGRKTDKLEDGKVFVRKERISITFRKVIPEQVKRPGMEPEITRGLYSGQDRPKSAYFAGTQAKKESQIGIGAKSVVGPLDKFIFKKSNS